MHGFNTNSKFKNWHGCQFLNRLQMQKMQVKMPELGTSVEADFISGRKLSGKLKPAHFVRVWFRKVGNAIQLEHS